MLACLHDTAASPAGWSMRGLHFQVPLLNRTRAGSARCRLRSAALRPPLKHQGQHAVSVRAGGHFYFWALAGHCIEAAAVPAASSLSLLPAPPTGPSAVRVNHLDRPQLRHGPCQRSHGGCVHAEGAERGVWQCGCVARQARDERGTAGAIHPSIYLAQRAHGPPPAQGAGAYHQAPSPCSCPLPGWRGAPPSPCHGRPPRSDAQCRQHCLWLAGWIAEGVKNGLQQASTALHLRGRAYTVPTSLTLVHN